MKTLPLRFTLAAVAAILVSSAVAQRPLCEVLMRDGRMLPADGLVRGAGDVLQLVRATGSETVSFQAVLAVLGTRVQDSALPAAHLAKGDVVRGLLVGGDVAGDTLLLQSAVLGRLNVAVERLECLVLRPEAARARDLVMPEAATEALFLPASLGFDRQTGTLHQFGEAGIRFQPEVDKAPRWFAPRELIGLRLSGALPPDQPAVAELCTRAADRIGLTGFVFEGATIRCRLEGDVEVTVSLADLGCLLRLDTGVVMVSGLEPVRVVEAAFDGDALMSWQRDLAVSGSMLAASGRCYARGLGVHSRSRLQFVVPPGVDSFHTRVAFDDSALQLPVRGRVAIAVRIEGVGKPTEFELAAGGAVQTVGPLEVQPGQVLSLEVEFGAGRDVGDRVDWLLPVFLPTAAAK
jgi:hypothetical protein